MKSRILFSFFFFGFMIPLSQSFGKDRNFYQTSNGAEPDNAYYFNGIDGVQALIGNPHADGQPGPFDFAIGTVEGWVRPNWAPGSHAKDPYIFSMIDWWGTRWGITMGKDYGSIGIHGMGDSWLAYPFQQGHWYHIAITFNADGTMTAHVNGQSIGTSTATVNTGTSGTPFKIGISWSWSNDEQFEGGIDEVRVWNTVRTLSEISANMNNVIPASSPGLIAYYKFNQISGTVLPDATSNGYNGNMIYWESNMANPTPAPSWVESYAMVVPVKQAPTNVSSQTFTLNWIAPPLGTVNTYLLDVATDAAFVNPLSGYNAYDAGLSLSKQLTGLTNNTTYYYRLRANKTSVDGQGAYTITDSINIDAVLPVDFLSFSLQKKGKNIVLEWTTSNEVNNNHFNILYSTDGMLWQTIATVPPDFKSGNSYTYTDATAANGKNYYRIQQVDNNGDSKYSEIRSLSFSGISALIKIAPNPVKDHFTISLGYPVTKAISYTLYNSSGINIKQGIIAQQVQGIDVNALPAGIYILKIADKERIKIVKQ